MGLKASSSDAELDEIVDEAIAALARAPAEKVLAAARKSKLSLYGPDMATTPTDLRPLKGVFAAADDVRRAIEGRTPEIKGAVVALLSVVEPDAGAAFLGRIMLRDLTGYRFGSWQTDLYYSQRAALELVGKRIPDRTLAELFLAGRITHDYLRKGVMSAIPLEQIAEVCRGERRWETGTDLVLADHQGLRDGREVLALLEQSSIEGRTDLLEGLMARLGELAYAPGIPFLARMAASDAPKGLPDSAMQAIEAMDTPDAKRALIDVLPSLLDGDWASTHGSLQIAVGAALELDKKRSTETLARYFTDEALSNPVGRTRATRILELRSDPVSGTTFDADARWLDVATRLLSGPLFDPARRFLANYGAKAVQAALKRGGYVAKARTVEPHLHAIPKKPRWLERYQKGEHDAVWAEIVALEDSAQDPAVAEEAMAVARAMMGRVKQNLERIVDTLKKRKYAFAAKPVKKVLAAPDPKAATQMKAIEKLLGGPLPLALRAFWEVVGSVDLTELDAAEDSAEGLGLLDPLMIEPPKMTLDLLKDEAEAQKQLPVELQRPPDSLPLALDPATKADADAANDAPYTLHVVGSRADAVLRQGGREVPFVEYLRATVAAGGFARLDPKAKDLTRSRELLTKGRIAF